MSAAIHVMGTAVEPATGLSRAIVPVLICAAVLAFAGLAVPFLRPLLNQPVQALRIDGVLRHLDVAQIGAAAGGVTTSRLFDIDLDVLRRRVEALPWVAHARVSRVWPDRIAVRVQERVPYARWNDASLIDSERRVFTPPPADLPNGLPILSAPDGHEAETAATFQGLREALDGGLFTPSGLRLDARGEWWLVTAQGIELRFGQGDPLAKTALLLGAVSRTLGDQLDQVAYVDLRYANGFAVASKDGTVTPPLGAKKHLTMPERRPAAGDNKHG